MAPTEPPTTSDAYREKFEPPNDVQIAICTRDEPCKAPASGHEPDCPIEAELKRTFGF